MGASAEEFEDWGEDLLLIDAAVPGSGEAWDYTSVAALPVLQGRHWLLAGGLDPANVDGASTAAHAWGVDVSSGVEASRGVKDLAKIRSFVQAAKGAAARVKA
jgi:phosphoribosylanthranilate isomerase